MRKATACKKIFLNCKPTERMLINDLLVVIITKVLDSGIESYRHVDTEETSH
jgi:hypothetical protein